MRLYHHPDRGWSRESVRLRGQKRNATATNQLITTDQNLSPTGAIRQHFPSDSPVGFPSRPLVPHFPLYRPQEMIVCTSIPIGMKVQTLKWFSSLANNYHLAIRNGLRIQNGTHKTLHLVIRNTIWYCFTTQRGRKLFHLPLCYIFPVFF